MRMMRDDDVAGAGVGWVGDPYAASVAPSHGARSWADGVEPGVGFDRAVWLGRDLAWEGLVAEADRAGRDVRFAEVSDDRLVEEVSVGAAQLDAALCVWLEQLAELVVRKIWAHQGARTPGAWLSWKLGIAGSTAREHVRVALRLRDFPAIRDRFAAGTLSYSKVRSLTRCGDPTFEPLLLAWADDATAAQLETIVAGFRRAQRALTDHDGELDGPDPAYTWRGRSNGDGTRTLTIRGPADQVAELEDAIDRLTVADVADRQTPAPSADSDSREDSGDSTGERDDLGGPVAARPRLAAVDRLDALCHTLVAAAAADTPPDTSGLDRHTLVLHATFDDLTGPDDTDSAATHLDTDGTGVEGSDGPTPHLDLVAVSDPHRRVLGMDRRTLQRLACDAGIVVSVSDRTDHGGSVVDVGRRSRTTTAALRRAVHHRDRDRCTFPGCGATRHLHAHHVTYWTDGGPTDLANLVLVCAFHHRFVHATGWHIEVSADGHHRYRPRPDDPAVENIPARPRARRDVVARAAPATASADALRPPTHTGDRYDLDIAVATLQRLHEHVRTTHDLAEQHAA